AFRRSFTKREEPIRAHRSPGVTSQRMRRLATYLSARAGEDRDNEYLRPGRWLVEHAAERGRRAAVRVVYDRLPAERPFVYFPLHVSDDYKIRRLIPHCADQGALVDLVADALP